MYEKILVPLDGSKTAEMVIPYAEQIAAQRGREVILVRVVEPMTADKGSQHQAYLESLAEQVQSQMKDWKVKEEVKVRGEILQGNPADELLHYADEHQVGLIAMTSRGSSIGGQWLLGTIAAKILRATDKPVLLVRSPASEAGMQEKRLVKRILVPLDGSRLGEAAIPYAEVLAAALNAELVLFHVTQLITTWGVYEGYPAQTPAPPDPDTRKASALHYLDSVAQPLKEKGLQVSSEVDFGYAADQIIDYAQGKAIDLIAMSTHGRSGIGRWVFGSVTDKVLHAGDTAVLVVPAARVRGTAKRTDENKNASKETARAA